MSKPAITALAPWYGAKRSLAPAIIEALGPHNCYWEPFCGSMAVLLAKPKAGMETVNDLHGDLINLARIIRDELDGPRLYRKLRRTWCSEEFQREARVSLETETDPVERAYLFFVASWLGRNGIIGSNGGNGFCVRNSANGGSPATRFESAVLSIPAWRQRLKRVIILRRDAFVLLSRIEDAPGVAIYCDPPYLTKGAKYVHDFEGPDHKRLADLLSRFKVARVVVSYYDHPALADLYPGWQIERPPANMSLRQMGKNMGKAAAPEVLLINDRSPRPTLEVATTGSGGLFS